MSSLVQSATAAVLALTCLAIGLDPLVEVFGYLAGVATIGMVMLMLLPLTTLSVLVFFRRHPGRAARRWTTLIVPVLAVLALSVAAWLVLSTFTLVTSAEPPRLCPFCRS